jgi:hypothetical protein
MPTISMFYGILIKMFFDDHAPPHFHAEYGEFELVIAINPIKIIQGDAPKRVKSMVLEWTALHQEELLLDWELCKNLQPPIAIEPLE